MKYSATLLNLESAASEFFAHRLGVFEETLQVMSDCLLAGGKILAFGNGGSAAQAQHFAAELVNKFLINRPALAALSLTTDTSALTSIANDENYSTVFSRQIEALGKSGDVAVALSTSGNSPSVISALEAARKRGLVTVALTGEGGGRLADISDHLLDVPSTSTPRIQEVHLILLHLLAEEIEIRLS